MLKRTIAKITVKSPPSQKKALVNAYNQECFWVYDGPILSNLKDLVRALKTMTKAQFDHHVTDEKNDFALWVEHILRDPECALEIKKTPTFPKLVKVVERRLRDYYV